MIINEVCVFLQNFGKNILLVAHRGDFIKHKSDILQLIELKLGIDVDFMHTGEGCVH